MEQILDTTALDKIATLARDAVVIEWRRQGHELTGRAAREVETRIMDRAGGVEIQGFLLDYMARINQGVPASEVRSDAATIRGLVRYARLRFRVGLNEAQGIAYRINNAHRREGIPSIGSQRFSATGRRTGFVEEGLDKESQAIEKIINDAVDEGYRLLIESFFRAILAGR